MYAANIGWTTFIYMTGSQFIENIKRGTSYVLSHKIKKENLPSPQPRTWREVFEFIFKQKTFDFNCLIPFEDEKCTVEYISNQY
jgi:hypothetical protein